jgi:hypothetical protein
MASNLTINMNLRKLLKIDIIDKGAADVYIKGTVARDFRPSVFFIKQSPLGA